MRERGVRECDCEYVRKFLIKFGFVFGFSFGFGFGFGSVSSMDLNAANRTKRGRKTRAHPPLVLAIYM